MPRYVFQMQLRKGELDRLLQLNEEYADVLKRACKAIVGLHRVEKYVFEDQYVELIDFDGEFEGFSHQLTADPEVRQFLRSVNSCFVHPLSAMTSREMACIQTLPE
ncbi:MAG TPA: hypothetical protein VNF75_00095 [Candidatus Dormibacteraeota bacterium]|nr:hypothetical protein [Candidatus Dormibacteraeota bacterium]